MDLFRVDIYCPIEFLSIPIFPRRSYHPCPSFLISSRRPPIYHSFASRYSHAYQRELNHFVDVVTEQKTSEAAGKVGFLNVEKKLCKFLFFLCSPSTPRPSCPCAGAPPRPCPRSPTPARGPPRAASPSISLGPRRPRCRRGTPYSSKEERMLIFAMIIIKLVLELNRFWYFFHDRHGIVFIFFH